MTFLHEALNAWSVAGTGLILGYMLVVAAMKYAATVGVNNDALESEQTRLLSSAENGNDEINHGQALSLGGESSESIG